MVASAVSAFLTRASGFFRGLMRGVTRPRLVVDGSPVREVRRFTLEAADGSGLLRVIEYERLVSTDLGWWLGNGRLLVTDTGLYVTRVEGQPNRYHVEGEGVVETRAPRGHDGA